MANDSAAVSELARIVVGSLAAGKSVEIDGLGTFFPDTEQGCRFEPRVQVFVAYVKEDIEAATFLWECLKSSGYSPWMDVHNLVPGQYWPRAIETAIESSEFFIACFSENSARKKGGFQAEIRYALDCARQLPLEDIFIVPVRLRECYVPRSIQKSYQYIDFFPDWPRGMRRLLKMMGREMTRRAAGRG